MIPLGLVKWIPSLTMYFTTCLIVFDVFICQLAFHFTGRKWRLSICPHWSLSQTGGRCNQADGGAKSVQHSLPLMKNIGLQTGSYKLVQKTHYLLELEFRIAVVILKIKFLYVCIYSYVVHAHMDIRRIYIHL